MLTLGLAISGLVSMEARAAEVLPPPELHFCALACLTLYLTTDGKGYATTRGTASSPRDARSGIWISRFDSTGLELERRDPPNAYFPSGLEGRIDGRIAPDGFHAIDAKIRWTFGLVATYDAEVTWGPLLNSIPGSGEAPRVKAARAQQQPAFGGDAGAAETTRFGEFDLAPYSQELAKSGLRITEVRAARVRERPAGLPHVVLIVSSRHGERGGEITGVKDYLEHLPGDISRRYGPEDIVWRSLVSTTGVDIYGGIDLQHVFQLNVELKLSADGEDGAYGRDLWQPTPAKLTPMTTTAVSEPAEFRAIVRRSIAANASRHPERIPAPDLGPGRQYGVDEKAAPVLPPGDSRSSAEGPPTVPPAQVTSDATVVPHRPDGPWERATFGLCHHSVVTAQGVRLTSKLTSISQYRAGAVGAPIADELTGTLVRAINARPFSTEEELHEAAEAAAIDDSQTADFQVTRGDGSIVAVRACGEVRATSGQWYSVDALVPGIGLLFVEDELGYLIRHRGLRNYFVQRSPSGVSLHYRPHGEDGRAPADRLYEIRPAGPDAFEMVFWVAADDRPAIEAWMKRTGVAYRIAADAGGAPSPLQLIVTRALQQGETLRSWVRQSISAAQLLGSHVDRLEDEQLLRKLQGALDAVGKKDR